VDRKIIVEEKKKMSSSPQSIKHISSVIQHTIELNIDVNITECNPPHPWLRSSGILSNSINLPDSKCIYKVNYQVNDGRSNRVGPGAKARYFFVLMKGVKRYINASWSLSVNGFPEENDSYLLNNRLETGTVYFVIDLRASLGAVDKIDHVKGKVTFTFEPETCKRRALKRSLSQALGNSKLSKKEEDFTISCQDQLFHFNRLYLSTISPVFERMQKEPLGNEHDFVKIDHPEKFWCQPETIQSFKNVIYNDSVDEEDLTPQLLMFCDYYDIKPIFQLCYDHIIQTFSKENYLERIKICYLLEDNQVLLTRAATFIKENFGKLEKSPEVMEFMKNNPECWIKIMELMMFPK